MRFPTEAIRVLQRRLKTRGFDPGPVDGQLGPRTENALGEALRQRRDELSAEHAADILGQSRARKVTAYLQLLANEAELDAGVVDGYWGPQTDNAVDELIHLDIHGQPPHRWRDFRGPTRNPNNWPEETPDSLRAFYGTPGEPPLTRIQLPYPLRLSWDLNQSVTRLACHEKVADSLSRVFSNVLDAYGQEGIKELRLDRFGGCFNPRRKRGGSNWSTHAWGISLDFDPERNRLQWGRDRAAFARPDYDDWWKAWEDEGWISLGRVMNYDWMHVQAARCGD